MSEDTTLNLSSDDKLNWIMTEMREQRGLLSPLNDRLTALEEKSYDTRPIWEQALKEIVETRTELRETRTELSQQVAELRNEVKSMNRKIGTLSSDVLGLRSEMDDVQTRLERRQ